MMELETPEAWDLFDENRNFLGKTCNRGEHLNDGEYHIIIEVWTVNSKGELLLTLRHPNKKEHPNKWEDTGGCIVSGETSRQGAVRELFEERGVVASEDELTFLGTVKERTSFTDIYVLHRDIEISELKLCCKETADAKWVSLDVLDKMIEDGALAVYAGVRLKQVRAAFEEQLRLHENRLH